MSSLLFGFIIPSDTLAELHAPHSRYPFRSLTSYFPSSLSRTSHKKKKENSKTQTAKKRYVKIQLEAKHSCITLFT